MYEFLQIEKKIQQKLFCVNKKVYGVVDKIINEIVATFIIHLEIAQFFLVSQSVTQTDRQTDIHTVVSSFKLSLSTSQPNNQHLWEA